MFKPSHITMISCGKKRIQTISLGLIFSCACHTKNSKTIFFSAFGKQGHNIWLSHRDMMTEISRLFHADSPDGLLKWGDITFCTFRIKRSCIIRKLAGFYSRSDFGSKALIISNIMTREQHQAEHLLCLKEMMQICSGILLTSWTRTGLIKGSR